VQFNFVLSFSILPAEQHVKVPEEIDRCIKKYEIETKKSRIDRRKPKVSPSCYP